MRQKKAFTSSDLIVRFVAPAFWRFFITFSSLFGELSYNIKKTACLAVLYKCLSDYDVHLLFHIGKTFDCLCEVLYGLICVPMFNPIAHTMLNMPLQYHLATFVQG